MSLCHGLPKFFLKIFPVWPLHRISYEYIILSNWVFDWPRYHQKSGVLHFVPEQDKQELRMLGKARLLKGQGKYIGDYI